MLIAGWQDSLHPTASGSAALRLESFKRHWDSRRLMMETEGNPDDTPCRRALVCNTDKGHYWRWYLVGQVRCACTQSNKLPVMYALTYLS